MNNARTFAVSEVFPDGRVMVFTYIHIDGAITAVMDVYSNSSMQDGKRYLNVQLNQSQMLPPIEDKE